MERLKEAVSSGESDVYKNVCLATGVGSIVGFCVGGRLGAKVAGKDHILANQLTPYKFEMQAHREYHSSILKGFVRNGSRWGWRAGVFAGLYSGVMTIMAEYRNKHDGFNFLVAGALTGATYKMLHGVRGMIVGTILGAVFSFPVAVVSHAVILMVPEDLKQKINQLEKEQKEYKSKKRVEPWQMNLEFTEKVIEQMERDLTDDNSTVEPS